ncbi:MAG: glycosyltransferase [Acidobacteriaceae bacterium]|nr:glycosyltransferase [Acidobacteriaceae bacterium]
MAPVQNELENLVLLDSIAGPTPGICVLPQFEGYIDYFGYSSTASGWLLCGWISSAWRIEDAKQIRVCFQRKIVSGDFITVSLRRPDLGERGRGMLLFISTTEQHDLGALISVEITFDDRSYRVSPTSSVRCLTAERIEAASFGELSRARLGKDRDRLAMLIARGDDMMCDPSQVVAGSIDSFAYCELARGWLFRGRVTCSWEADEGPDSAAVRFERGEIAGTPISLFHSCDDLDGRGLGLVLYVRGDGRDLGSLVSIELRRGESSSTIEGSRAIKRNSDEQIRGVAALTEQAQSGPARNTLRNLLARQPWRGADTLAALSDSVHLHFDEVICCPPDGMVLIGWFLARPGRVLTMTIRGQNGSAPLDFKRAIRSDRPDVIQNFGAERGFNDVRCGFILFVPYHYSAGDRSYVEIETDLGEVAFKPLSEPKLEGTAAVKRLAGDFDLAYDDLARAFDQTIGPALLRINRHRLARQPQIKEVEFGEVTAAPRFSLVIPVYGRIDLIEPQLALFSIHPPVCEYEFIYVLDDPPKRCEAERLFDSVYRRFRIPFRALFLEDNVGFGRASNFGLRSTNGRYVCFLNSDVFPRTADWLERLAAQLTKNPSLGAIGPLLLYEDDSIQHQGMTYKRLPELGNWLFCDHPGKGRRQSSDSGLRHCVAITGACMVMERDLAQEMGGFNEEYLNDFEDADLCLRLHERGLGCAVDLSVELYHLERKSHPGSAKTWSRNITLYNAWLHNRLWEQAIVSRLSPAISRSLPEAPALAEQKTA